MRVGAKPLREQVYEFLKAELNRGALQPGDRLDQNRLADGLGVSRTPLREALLQLAAEGFVTILPRRGIVVNVLTPEEVRHLYEIVGALEAAALLAAAPALGPREIARMRALCREMRRALKGDDFAAYYEKNLAFHDLYLSACGNARLAATVRLLKERLYDFPRREGFVKAWEEASVGEHDTLVERLAGGDARGAADYIRDVHWSYAVQEPFIREYYFTAHESGKRGKA